MEASQRLLARPNVARGASRQRNSVSQLAAAATSTSLLAGDGRLDCGDRWQAANRLESGARLTRR